ncbi:glycosyl hydrolase family 76-domain-containing protein [Globomyces pollinis-pini]|nr:glycosyl hydrolase family 76-domain-containing protein [Globomyces pollinis-pini]
MYLPITSLLILSPVLSLTINLDDRDQVLLTARRIADNLMNYYDESASQQGTIPPKVGDSEKGWQWYEGGIMWGLMLDYIRLSGNHTYGNTIVNGLTKASFGPIGSFLGSIPKLSETLEGKWNDDILWWAMAVTNAGELYGMNTIMPGGVSYLQLANLTYAQSWAQWDDKCGGGVWWSRDRNNLQNGGYKSTITNVQQILLGSHISYLIADQSYNGKSIQIYNWLQQTGLLTARNLVNDGIRADKGCSINTAQYSYKSGILAGGLAWLYKSSNNYQYMQAAQNVALQSLESFSKNDIITDPCEPDCTENAVTPKGAMIHGLGYVYEFSTDNQVKSNIKNKLSKSMTAMLNTCDSDYNCGNYWFDNQNKHQSVHYQINALHLITAYLKTFPDLLTPSTNSQPAPTNPPSFGSPSGPGSVADVRQSPSAILIVVFCALIIFFITILALCFFSIRNAFKKGVKIESSDMTTDATIVEVI